MTTDFDKGYWESHWQQAEADGRGVAANPYLARELGGLTPGTALDAGCGEGAEAMWLAGEGWRVTGADISAEALARASVRATKEALALDRVQWIEADLSVWEPDTPFDLVTTHYAHPAMPQLAFYQRVASWVARGGTLLIVGHLRNTEKSAHGDSHQQGAHGHEHPDEAAATAASITAELNATEWQIVTADEPIRTLTNRAGETAELHDVVVRAIRRV